MNDSNTKQTGIAKTCLTTSTCLPPLCRFLVVAVVVVAVAVAVAVVVVVVVVLVVLPSVSFSCRACSRAPSTRTAVTRFINEIETSALGGFQRDPRGVPGAISTSKFKGPKSRL